MKKLLLAFALLLSACSAKAEPAPCMTERDYAEATSSVLDLWLTAERDMGALMQRSVDSPELVQDSRWRSDMLSDMGILEHGADKVLDLNPPPKMAEIDGLLKSAANSILAFNADIRTWLKNESPDAIQKAITDIDLFNGYLKRATDLMGQTTPEDGGCPILY